MEATLKLISQWTQPKTNEYADQVTEVFLNYSPEVIFKCADPMQGIGASRPNEMPRRHPPSVGEIKYFCDHTVMDDSRPKPLIAPAPSPERSAEDKARVAARAKEVLAELTRRLGRATAEDKRAESEQVLTQSAHAKIEPTESLRRSVAEQRTDRERAHAEEQSAWLADPPLGG